MYTCKIGLVKKYSVGLYKKLNRWRHVSVHTKETIWFSPGLIHSYFMHLILYIYTQFRKNVKIRKKKSLSSG